MEKEIESLLEILDSSSILFLPCFIDQANNIYEINFRIGLSEGPQITFKSVKEQYYLLTIYNGNNEFYEHPIIIESDQFIKCQNIRNEIYKLNMDREYLLMIEQKIEILITNLANIVNPIISNIRKINKNKI